MTAIIVAGLGFGDEGKGTVVDYLARKHKAHTVVRYNGGGQAAHNVVTDDGRHHTFAQFGAGTFSGAKTFLSRHMLVNPVSLFAEAKSLEAKFDIDRPLQLIHIDRNAVLTTPFHMALNRLRELSRSNENNYGPQNPGGRHGSCGMGVGETARLAETGDPLLALRAGDLVDYATLRQKLLTIQEKLVDDARTLGGTVDLKQVEMQYDLLQNPSVLTGCQEMFQTFAKCVSVESSSYLKRKLAYGTTVFEGAQGVLLDRQFGFFPYVTRSHTTFKNAVNLLEGFNGRMLRLGVLRSYATRHGAGPFVTESDEVDFKEPHNRTDDPWQQAFRTGHFDFVMARYAIEVLGGVDEIAMTHMDRVSDKPLVCTSYGKGSNRSISLTRLHPNGIETDTRVTELLRVVAPQYETLDSSDAFLTKVETDLKAPVRLLSHGPRACDKVARSNIRNVA